MLKTLFMKNVITIIGLQRKTISVGFNMQIFAVKQTCCHSSKPTVSKITDGS